MARTKTHKLSADEKKQRAQQQTINKYKKQERWLGWAGAAILVLILFLVLSVGYATDWGQSSKDALKNVGKDSLNTTSPSTAEPAAGAGSGSGGGTSSTGTSSGTTSTGATSNNTERSTTSTSTTTNNTTTNNSDNTNGEVSNVLRTLLSEAKLGESVDGLLSRAQSLGISSDCSTNALLVQTCIFKVGDNTVTTKNLIMNGLLSSVTSNF